MDLIKAKEVFKKYTDSYRKYGEMIELKINHTDRVRQSCVWLAKKLNLSKEEVEIAEVCGLLHDIGRFEQFKRYNSHIDHETVNHGDFGAEILTENNFINEFATEKQKMIIQVVKYHNKYRIPRTLREETRKYIDIVRDADKIDSLYLMDTKEIFYEAKNNKINEAVMAQVRKREMVIRQNIKEEIDFLALELAFIFDLIYKESFELVKEKDYVNNIIDIYINSTSNKEFIEQLEEMRTILNNYIEERLTC